MSSSDFGKVPDKEFANGPHQEMSLKVGIITRVDDHHMKADIHVITGGTEQLEISLTQGMAGPRSFWGGVPEVNSMVILGFRRRHKQLTEAMILGYLPTGLKSGMRFDPFSAVNPGEISPEEADDVLSLYGATQRYKSLRMKSGDVGGMSAAGSEFVLSKDVRITNRAGDFIELRDSDRTLVSQALHRVESDSATYLFSGAIRRGDMNLPIEIFKADGKTFKTEKENYYGLPFLQKTHPRPNGPSFSNAQGVALSRIVDVNEFPPSVFATGRAAFYASPTPATNFEDAEDGGVGLAYTERRIELRHMTDMVQEVRGEIDGFSMTRPAVFIEQVLGTYVGNDAFNDPENYARLMKPRIFDGFNQRGRPRSFRLEQVERDPPKDEANTKTAAYVFRIRPPKAVEDTSFAVAVNKEGKLFLNVPGSKDEDLPDAKNISVEANFDGAVKARIGKANPTGVSLNLTLEGGLHADIGSDSNGNAITVAYHSGVKSSYKGVPNTEDIALSEQVQGDKEQFVSGNQTKIIAGKYRKRIDGGYLIDCSRLNINSLGGFSGNYGEYNTLVSGKTQANYAQQVVETIALGGKLSTILAGGYVGNILSGAYVQNVLAGAMSFACPAGAFSVTVGTGAISVTTGAGAVSLSTGAGAMSIAAGAGAVAITAGLACNITAGIAISLTSPQVLLGSAVAPLGVARGIPMMPPGSPSLDWLTGLPLQGSAVIRSL